MAPAITNAFCPSSPTPTQLSAHACTIVLVHNPKGCGLRAQAFEASADALTEVVDCCPEAWLDALQEPLMSLVDVAAGASASGALSKHLWDSKHAVGAQ